MLHAIHALVYHKKAATVRKKKHAVAFSFQCTFLLLHNMMCVEKERILFNDTFLTCVDLNDSKYRINFRDRYTDVNALTSCKFWRLC